MRTGALVLQDTSAPPLQLTLQQQTLVRPQLCLDDAESGCPEGVVA
jgi:hypothetical protein